MRLSGIAAPLMRRDVDTDALFPGPFIRQIDFDPGKALFGHWRYTDIAALSENPDFILNREPYRRASILLSGANFGCGSSREHAVWALLGFGIRAVVAESFGDIFHNNAIKNGLLPVTLEPSLIERLAARARREPESQVAIDLSEQHIRAPDVAARFEMAPFHREMLMEGIDEIGLTLKSAASIEAFQRADARARPWIYRQPA